MISLSEFRQDYYDRSLTAGDVAKKHNISTRILILLASKLGLPPRKVVVTKIIVKNQSSGPPVCSISCINWQYCNREKPEFLPCEWYMYLDENPEIADRDNTIYYYSPKWSNDD